jgi:hypothetical protein
LNRKLNLLNVLIFAVVGLMLSLFATGPVSVYASVHAVPDPSLDRFVAPAGIDDGDCTDSEHPCKSILFAIDLALDGETIGLAEGNYERAVLPTIDIEKNLSLRGGWDSSFTNQIGISSLQNSIWIYYSAIAQIERLDINTAYANTYGIYVTYGNLILRDSVVRNNGTGIWVEGGTARIINTTISGNGFTPGGNGGIVSWYADGKNSVTVINSTITNNKGNGVGGLHHFSGAGSFTIANSIIIGNINYYGYEPDCNGTFISGGFNIIGNTYSGACVGKWSSSDIIGTYAKPIPVEQVLNPILTKDPVSGQWYHPLVPGPAIDAGNPAAPGTGGKACPATDQLGTTRPQGKYCDIGAVESGYSVSSLSVQSNGSRDGWILESTEASTVGGSRSATESLNIGDDKYDRQYRTILYFNTAPLPDHIVITGVSLLIKKQGLQGTDPFAMHGDLIADMYKGYFGNPALEASDFQATASRSSIGKFTSMGTTSGWYGLSLRATDYRYFRYINLTSITQFRLRFATDDNDNHEADYIKFYSGDDTVVAANRPVLVIEYVMPWSRMTWHCLYRTRSPIALSRLKKRNSQPSAVSILNL